MEGMINMNQKDYFKDMYKDFFGIEEIPKIEVKEREKISKNKDELMKEFYDKINSSYLDEDSKQLLKQMIEYARKYEEGLEKNYIPFRIIFELQNKELEQEILEILKNAISCFHYIDKSNVQSLSLFSKNIEIEKGYENHGIVIIKDIKGMELKDTADKKLLFHELSSCLNQYPKRVTILSVNSKDEKEYFFTEAFEINEHSFSFVLKEKEMNSIDVLQKVLESVVVSEEDQVKLLDYINATFKGSSLSFDDYKNHLIEVLSFQKKIPDVPKEKSLEEVFASLNELVGLKKVKQVLYELADMMKLKEKTKDQLNFSNVNLHMVFLGNPGTGKTTVARLVADILHHLGYLKENKLLEVSAKDLVAEYVGQTAPKTNAVVERALGGVLFVDEAYSLAVKDGNSYNAEAIATLIQAMENHRDELVVIFAGYTKEMQDFLNSNSGIASRIGYTLEFDDYSEDELIEIFKGMIKKSGFLLSLDAEQKVRTIIQNNLGKPNFGNARFIRNVYEKSVVKHAFNVKNKKRMDVLKTITKDDINADNLI